MAKKSVLDYIKSEYGLEVEEYAGTEIDLKRKGYRQLSAEDIARIDALFQFAPQIVANRITEGHYKEAFKAATEGSYRILMDVGAHLGISHKTPGAFSPNTYDANNHFLRPAELIPNDATLSISQAEQLVANAFNAASLVTGQYFMAQISSSLNTLKTSVSGISDYIEDEKLSKFQSYLNKLESIARRLPFLRNNPMGTMNYVQDAEEIERFADELMDFCERRIERIEKDARLSDGEDTIDKNANDILKYLLLSYQSLLMFCEGTNVAICLEGITDANHLQVIYDGMEKKVQQYEDLFSSCIKWISHYVHNVHTQPDARPSSLGYGTGLDQSEIQCGRSAAKCDSGRSISPGGISSAGANWNGNIRCKDNHTRHHAGIVVVRFTWCGIRPDPASASAGNCAGRSIRRSDPGYIRR